MCIQDGATCTKLTLRSEVDETTNDNCLVKRTNIGIIVTAESRR